MITYAIGDLHGRYDILERVIDAIEADAGADGGTFIVLGDFIDRGPQSRQIIERLMAGPQRSSWDWIILQGNHEAMMLTCLADTDRIGWWIGNGGGATLDSYNWDIPLDDVQWLKGLPVYHEDEHRIYVHAGVRYDKPVGQTKKQTLQWMLYPSDRVYGGAEINPDIPHMSGKHVVHGHHQSPNHPLLLPHRTNLDTYAWATSRMVVGVFDGPGGPVRTIQVMGRPTL